MWDLYQSRKCSPRKPKSFTAEGQQEIIAELNRLATRQDAETDRLDKDADARTGKNEETGAVDDRKNFYCLLGKLNRAALCLSGGGIRSATFSLGVIQGLAMHAYDKNAGKITFVSGTGVPRDKVPAQAGQSIDRSVSFFVDRVRRRLYRILAFGLA